MRSVSRVQRCSVIVAAVLLLVAGCSDSEPIGAAPPSPTVEQRAQPTATVVVAEPTAEPVAQPDPSPTAAAAPDEPATTQVELGSSPDGFDYLVEYPRSTAAVNGQILVRRATGETMPAMIDETTLLPLVSDLVFGPDGLVGFTSNHYNYGPMVFLGRLGERGRIRDLHRVGYGLYSPERPMAIDYFDDQGRLVAGEFELDTATDPRFVNTAAELPAIDDTVLLPSAVDAWGNESGDWHLGETLGTKPACGASTLYRTVPDGWQRVLHAPVELDTIVAVHATPFRGIGGVDTVASAREVVLVTECPEEYDGQRLHWATDGTDYGDNGPALVMPLQPLLIDGLVVDEVKSLTAHFSHPWVPYVSDLLLDVRRPGMASFEKVGVSLPEDPSSTEVVLSVLPVVDDRAAEFIPRGRVGVGVWLVHSVSEPDRLVRVDPTSGEVTEELWSERPNSNRVVHSVDCENVDQDQGHEIIDVVQVISGPLLDQVTTTRSVGGEVISESTNELRGYSGGSLVLHYCNHRLPHQRSVTLMQLTNLAELAGFSGLEADRSIDPTAALVATWEGERFMLALDQSRAPEPASAGTTKVPCRLGQLTVDRALPAGAQQALRETCKL